MPSTVRWRFRRLLQALELFGMGVASGLAPQGLALAREGLFQGNAGAPGGCDHLVARDLQQARVHRMGDGLLLHGGVHDQALELDRFDGLAVYGGVDGGLEQLFDSGLADGGPKAPDLGGIARQARLVVGHAAEVLPHDVLGPALHKFLVAELVGVLQVQQAGHQANGKARAAGRGDAGTGKLQAGAEQVILLNRLAAAAWAFEHRRKAHFNLGPGQPACQYRQGVAQIDHLDQPWTEKIGRIASVGHGQKLPGINTRINDSRGIPCTGISLETQYSCGLQRFRRAD